MEPDLSTYPLKSLGLGRDIRTDITLVEALLARAEASPLLR